jgi:hypothetical protein
VCCDVLWCGIGCGVGRSVAEWVDTAVTVTRLHSIQASDIVAMLTASDIVAMLTASDQVAMQHSSDQVAFAREAREPVCQPHHSAEQGTNICTCCEGVWWSVVLWCGVACCDVVRCGAVCNRVWCGVWCVDIAV